MEDVILFSGGGKGQLMIWKLSKFSFHLLLDVDISLLFQITYDLNFRILSMSSFRYLNDYIIILGTSDSTIKIIYYDYEKNTLFPWMISDFHNSPVLNVNSVLNYNFITGSTIGKTAIYDLSKELKNFSKNDFNYDIEEDEIEEKINKEIIIEDNKKIELNKVIEENKEIIIEDNKKTEINEEIKIELDEDNEKLFTNYERNKKIKFKNIQPIISYQSHQNGVNSLYSFQNESFLKIASGGDDQSVHITEIENNEIKEQIKYDNQHSSSVMGIYTNQDYIFSVSIDQRLNVYYKNKFIDSYLFEVMDCSNVEVIEYDDYFLLFIVGDGLQLIEINKIK